LFRFVRFCLPALLTLATQLAVADNWTQPTPDELKMTSEPGAPGAAVTCLSMSVWDEYNRAQTHQIYVRMKILTEEGRKYADIEIPYDSDFVFKSVEARTVHSDGSAIVFSGEPYDKSIEKDKHSQRTAKVITLPDVQVGSILEYRIVYVLGRYISYYPRWYVQRRFFVRKAHYEYAPDQVDYLIPRFFPVLPKGAEVRVDTKRKVYSLDIENVPPLVDEDYQPPMESLSYRVLFYYTDAKSPDDFWKKEGASWSKSVDGFLYPSDLRAAAAQITGGNANAMDKTKALYGAVMKFENTDFTRERTNAENKADRVKIENAVDIWKAKRGYSNEIALLYVALARASGLNAYVARVVDRSEAIFLPEYASMSQLNDFIAIVSVDGKDVFLDPGARYCPFGVLDWKHAGTRGLRQTDHGTELMVTPSLGYKSSSVMRSADLSIDASGVVTGTLRVSMTGISALVWRQGALSSDELEVHRRLVETLKKGLPAGLEIKVNEIKGLADYEAPLVAVIDVKGTLGNLAGKRMIVPATLFATDSLDPFEEKTRVNPVDLEFPYVMQDEVTVHVPESLTAESVPQNAEVTLPRNALYRAGFKQENSQIKSSRLLLIANNLYSTDEYGALREFFQKMTAKDKEQATLKVASSVAGGGAGN
jgi:Domain of Unknown Function with PDB structure (DUF3857)/Transglutaminase-like superfamily